ncbi:MAG: sigma-70 family RNA polymerase sigma factor [Acidobacteria bacterium]|nr:sigma-70 family RNA polymerase sigma factor [Acidobacteriota bacterium]
MTTNNELSEMDAYALRCIKACIREMRRNGMTPEDCDDLTQELFLKYLERKDGFDPARGSYKTFVSCLIRNRAASLLGQIRRTSARLPLCPLPCACKASPDDPAPEPSDAIEEPRAKSVDLTVEVRRVVGSLPARLRHVASRITTEPAIEIASEMGVSRHRVYQLVAQLRSAFTNAGLGPVGAQ